VTAGLGAAFFLFRETSQRTKKKPNNTATDDKTTCVLFNMVKTDSFSQQNSFWQKNKKIKYRSPKPDSS
jgi:hypothetical protein